MIMNPHFNTEAGEYLEAHGYRKVESHSRKVLHYFRDNKMVSVMNDHIDFFEGVETTHGRLSDLQCYQSHSGIASLSFCSWVMLFHISGIVTLKEFAAKAKAQGNNMCEDVREIFGYAEPNINDMAILWPSPVLERAINNY